MRVAAVMVTVLAALLPTSGSAQQVGGYAPTVLLVPAGTRALGFGNAFVAGAGAEALFYNPAQIGTQGSTLSVARFGGAATLGSFAGVGRLAAISVAIGVRLLDFGAEAAGFPSPAGSLLIRGPVDATSLDAMVAVQKSWFGIRFGGAAHYVSEQQNSGRAAAALFDAGAARVVAGVTVALSVQNLGPGLTMAGVTADPPTRVSLGAMREGLRLGTFFDLALAASVSREAGGRVIPGGGAELTYEPVEGWTFAGRVGLRRGDPAGVPGASAVSLGGSFGLDALSLDYAFQPDHGVAGGTHRIGVRIR
jgi:hypothetical protein